MNRKWSNIELTDSINAYLRMQNLLNSNKKIVKKDFYKELSSKHDRTIKAFEYRMQNISYVLSLHGREWIKGLRPAENVGTNVIKQIEKILSQIEKRPLEQKIIFESEVQAILKKNPIEIPTGVIKPKKKETISFTHERSAKNKAWILHNSKGVCEICLKPAPFKTKNGVSYLEVHHVKRLCDGGSDTPQNTVALCPNCHKEIHYGLNSKLLVNSLYNSLTRLVKE